MSRNQRTVPSPEHSLDRINNNGDYCPENCRWASKEEQANNKRNNRLITYQGITLSMTQWERRLGLNKGRIRYKVNKKGLSFEDALASLISTEFPANVVLGAAS
ncbi:hypothetical protein LEP3755_34040 [Leptolyngbya sp. NIES-3755]|nr:hypothetical protein LEP3755_34040 [Leptolyngbya sp. NIES-3755]